MPRIERVYDHNFLIIDKTPLSGGKDGLSLKARGFLCTISSLSPDWVFTVSGLNAVVPDGERAIKSCISELESFGYLKREQSRTDGKLSGNVWYISDVPVKEWASCSEQDSPLGRNALAENAPARNVGQLSINQVSTDVSSTKRDTEASEAAKCRFGEVWSEYPKKANRKGAEKAYRSAVKRGADHDDILKGVRSYAERCRREGTDQRYMLHCSTFINNERWNDDWSSSAAPSQSAKFDFGNDSSRPSGRVFM